MADNLVKLMDENGYRQLINMLISIKSSQQENAEKCISVWQPNTMYQKDKVVLVVNDTTYSEYICKATHMSAETFDETYWTLVSCVDFEGYTEEELLAMLNLTQEELDSLQNILNDDEIQTDHAWSSSKVYTEIINCLIESKKFTIAEVAKIVSFSYKVVTSEDEVIDDKAIYLIENSSGAHDMYLLVDGSPSKVGNTSIDLSDYLKKENIVDTFDGTATYTDSDKVFSTKATKEALDTKLNKSAIVTTLDDTVTDAQIPSALVTKTELDKKVNIEDVKTAIDNKTETFDGINTNFKGIKFKVLDNGYFSQIISTENGIVIDYTLEKDFHESTNRLHIGKDGTIINTVYSKNDDGTYASKYQRLCMTSVPDVSDVPINFISGTPFINVTASYVVKDGWCTIMFSGGSSLTVSSNADNLVIAKNLPKPIKTMRYTSQLWGNASSSCLLTVTTDGNLATWLNTSCNGCYAYMSISYQVAEDWRP